MVTEGGPTSLEDRNRMSRIGARGPAGPRGKTPARGVLALALLFAAASTPAAAAWRVVFQDMRTLVADAVESQGDFVSLHLEGGAEVIVPAAAILELRAYTPPPPPPPEAEPAVAALQACTGPFVSWEDEAGIYVDVVTNAASAQKLDPELVVAVALAESRFEPLALSPKGAQGVMQLMPHTARQLKVGDVWSPRQNIEAGARWLRRLLDAFGGDLDLALAAYNAGEDAVRRFNGVPPYPETLIYVQRVKEHLSRFRCGRTADPQVGLSARR